jgi:hypothetical protein
LQRQSQGKTTATAISWRVADGATVGFGHPAGQGQSKAGTLNATGQGIVSTEKLLKNLLLAPCWNTSPSI